jgi:hypothetical protein
MVLHVNDIAATAANTVCSVNSMKIEPILTVSPLNKAKTGAKYCGLF